MVKDKPPVLIIVKRGKPKVRFCVMKKGVKARLRELLGGEVILNTDEYTIYEGIAEGKKSISA